MVNSVLFLLIFVMARSPESCFKRWEQPHLCLSVMWYSDTVLQGTVFIWDFQGLHASLEVQLKGCNIQNPTSSGPEKLALPRKGMTQSKPTWGALLVSQGPTFAPAKVPPSLYCWLVNQCKNKSLQSTNIPDLSCAWIQRDVNEPTTMCFIRNTYLFAWKEGPGRGAVPWVGCSWLCRRWALHLDTAAPPDPSAWQGSLCLTLALVANCTLLSFSYAVCCFIWCCS